MAKQIDLMGYLSAGIDQLIADVLKSSFKNPKETAFFLKYKGENDRNEKLRQSYEDKGSHIPPFLISSITEDCNLHCKGCYARANGLCDEDRQQVQLTAAQWKAIFDQAAAIGVSFVLLAGGEPLMRRDVLEEAIKEKSILFPVFTNGTLLDDGYLDLFDKSRNLIPVLSLEGGRQRTDERRGAGAYDTIVNAMQRLNKHGILFGASLTVTADNAKELLSKPFVDSLVAYGCKLAFYISYVPVEPGTAQLAQTEPQKLLMEQTLEWLRSLYRSFVFLSFPGDEQHMGGCLAAGRGFFHINAQGDAQACPFAPYSDRSLQTHTLLQVLDSPFFKRLKEEKLVGGEHDGGCTLFAHEAEVKALLDR